MGKLNEIENNFLISITYRAYINIWLKFCVNLVGNGSISHMMKQNSV